MSPTPPTPIPPDDHSNPARDSGTLAYEPVSDVDRLLQALLQEAGAAALRHFRRTTPSVKADGSFVTAADQEAQSIIMQGLVRAYGHPRVAAEEDVSHPDVDHRPSLPDDEEGLWVVDPIDGTASFVEGLAYWGPTVAHIGRDPSGHTVVHASGFWLPRLGDWFFQERGRGAFLNGRPLPPLEDGPLRRSDVLSIPSRLHSHVRLDWPGKARSLGSIAAHLAMVAAGGIRGAFIPRGWETWDTAAGLALIHAVGGQAVRLDGRPLDIARDRGSAFFAGSPKVIEWLSTPGRLTYSYPRQEKWSAR